MQTPFWLNDPSILFRNDQIGKLWPTELMTSNEKLNAITRLVVVLTLVGFLVTKNMRVAVTGFVTLVAISVLHTVQRRTAVDTEMKGALKEGFATLPATVLNKMHYTRPKEDNPAMNVLLPEIVDDPKRPEAAPAFNKTITEEMNKKTQEFVVSTFDNKTDVDKRLFKDLGDSWDFEQSMRTWYATPNTQVPNDQKAFAEYCYGDMISCKEGNGLACTLPGAMPPHWIDGGNP